MNKNCFAICIRFWVFALAVLLFHAPLIAQKKYKDYPEFERHIYSSSKGTMPYRLLKPKNYDPNKKYPLVLFLHGAGERGTENLVPLTHLAPAFIKEENRQKYPCFVLVPQCPKGRRWVEVDWGLEAHDMPPNPSISEQLAIEILDKIIKENSVDVNRLYITGLSMGGYGTWDMIARYPDKFAAAVPICGGGDEKTASKIKHIPLWAFHGSLDRAVKPSRSRNMIKAIQEAGGKPGYTEYPHVGHGSWKPAYQEPELFPWLFSKQKNL